MSGAERVSVCKAVGGCNADVVEEVEAILSTRKDNRKAIEKAIKSLTPDQKRELHFMVESEGYLRDAT